MGCAGSKSQNINDNANSSKLESEKKFELVFKAKRQNVFTAGYHESSDEVSSSPPLKVVPKSQKQKDLISNNS